MTRWTNEDYRGHIEKQIGKKSKNPKYKNSKVEIRGIVFDSKKEGNRYVELTMMEKAGIISDLKVKPDAFVLAPAVKLNNRTKPALRYFPDFSYIKSGIFVVEDTKGVQTEAFRIKRHLMKSIHGIEITCT